tara:strand:+ start:648 stop:836 length:189 start_codon:yes stop_codon:yes gene_type:complete
MIGGDMSEEFKYLRPIEKEICRLAIKYQMDVGKMTLTQLDNLLSEEDKRSLKYVLKYGKRPH